jgi:copper(I)-binding protein
MRPTTRLITLFCLALFALPALAAETLSVTNAWVREAPPGMQMLAGYMTIHNAGAKERKLVAAQSPDFGNIELHRSMVENGMAKMIPQKFMPVPAHGMLHIAPGGYHLMLMKPKRQLKAGDKVPFTLRFADGETLKITATVKRAEGPMEGGGHMNMH